MQILLLIIIVTMRACAKVWKAVVSYSHHFLDPWHLFTAPQLHSKSTYNLELCGEQKKSGWEMWGAAIWQWKGFFFFHPLSKQKTECKYVSSLGYVDETHDKTNFFLIWRKALSKTDSEISINKGKPFILWCQVNWRLIRRLEFWGQTIQSLRRFTNIHSFT